MPEKKLVNNTRAAMGSRMECPIGSKATKTALAMTEVELEMDPDGDTFSKKGSDGSWM